MIPPSPSRSSCRGRQKVILVYILHHLVDPGYGIVYVGDDTTDSGLDGVARHQGQGRRGGGLVGGVVECFRRRGYATLLGVSFCSNATV